MNFQKIAPIEGAKVYLDLAFRKARKKTALKDLTGSTNERVRKREAMKVDIIKDDLTNRLQKVLDDFPSFNRLPEFYLHLAKITLDYGQLKKSMAAVSWAIDNILKFQKMYARSISRSESAEKCKLFSNQFYGRISSIMKQIDPQLEFLEDTRRTMKKYPDIKEMFTVCLYGFPNIGKTTLLNKLTGSGAKTAAYSFTTKSINCSYLTVDGNKIQVLDVPGTLARKEKMNLIELQAKLTLEYLADVVVYVFDMTEPYPLIDQEKLYDKVKKIKPTIVYLSKQDILNSEQQELIKKLKMPIFSFDELKKEILTRYEAIMKEIEIEAPQEHDI
jgi:nucleolar GTP-binding protein